MTDAEFIRKIANWFGEHYDVSISFHNGEWMDCPSRDLRRIAGRLEALDGFAPELLASLEEVVALSDRDTDVWNRAKAAIAKAKEKR